MSVVESAETMLAGSRTQSEGKRAMPEGMNVEISHQLSEQEQEDEKEEKKRKARWEVLVEIIEVAVLAIVAIATAWSGYQAAR